MFALHESTRILLCRVGFFVLCVAPTSAVISWCLYVNTSAYTRAHERAIEARLGWRTRLARASSPRPGLVLYEGLDLLDPPTGQLLARLPAVEVQGSGDETRIRLSLPVTINGGRLAEFWKLALGQLRENADWRHLQLQAGNVTWHLTQSDQSFTDVAAQTNSEGHQRRLSLRFRRAAASDAPAEPAELTIARNHASTPPSTTVYFTTGATPLPCDLLSGVWPAVQRLGRTSTIQGHLQATEQSGQWQAQLSGRLNEIDLDLLMQPFPHRLSGTGQVDFDRIVIRESRIESAAGRLVAGPGTISRSLVQAAHMTLGLEAAPRAMRGTDNHLAYERLTLSFEIGSHGLVLKGEAADQPGSVLADKTEVLLRAPDAGAQPVLNLVRTLVPQSAVQVPATRETDELTRLLPVPSVVTPPGQEAPLPHARSLRVGPHRQ